MLQALGHILPIAVAVAISSVPITAAILILLSPKRNQAALPFLIGWVFGIALVVTLFTVFASALPQPKFRGPDLAAAIGEIIVGVAMVAFAIITWRRSRGKPARTTEPAYLRAIATFGALPAFGIALALNFRAKGILLAIAAGLAINSAQLSTSETVISIAIYTIIGASTVAVPIIVTLAAPEKMQPRLVSARAWISKNNSVVTVLILLMVGVFIIGTGLSSL